MHRKALLEKLAEYRSRYPEEKPCIDRFEHFVTEHPDCFERALKIGHVTGSAWLVNRAGTHTLLTHHRKLNRWLQPGGHSDGHPAPGEVALREACEESGIIGLKLFDEQIFDLDIHRIPLRGEEPEHDHYDVRFVVRAVDSETYTVSGESHDLCWAPVETLASLTGEEESMLRMRRKWVLRRV